MELKMELPEGLHFRFEHCRNYLPGVIGFDVIPISPLGGMTIARLENEDKKVLAIGYATCSDTEQCVKKIGRDISSGRAWKSYQRSLVDGKLTGV